MAQSSNDNVLELSLLSVNAKNIYSAVPEDFPFYKVLQVIAAKRKAKIKQFEEAYKRGLLKKVGEGEEADYFLNDRIIAYKNEVKFKELEKAGMPYRAEIVRTKNKKTFFVIYYVEGNEEYFMAIIEKK